ncbi:MAG: ATP-grasp domain-containing protein [Pseudobdellovibrionaceae bacterium]|nr:ATP-grasp domain-containing protein [Bdellovibrionales bacterium]USN48801.1 MAG: ATP-grasp domain-containing protein [Pseudobdellovibrionaceae bacterium]
MRILLLLHSDLVPPEKVKDESTVDWNNTPWTTEYDVYQALRRLGHNVQVLGVYEDLKVIRETLQEFRPSIIFNLLEEFKGEAIFDQNVVSYLELLGFPYTGCNPKGLILARDKALSKKILSFHKINSPKFQVLPKNQKKKAITIKDFPVIVKCLNEEASLGLSQASVVSSSKKVRERAEFIHDKFNTDAIAEEFIEGREFFVGVFGNYRLTVLPPWELYFLDSDTPKKEFYSTQAKYNEKYRQRKGIGTGPAKIENALALELQKVARRTYKALGLSGYARIDLRVSESGKIYVLEANPNPDIAKNDDFAASAQAFGLKYDNLIQKILLLGKKWSP